MNSFTLYKTLILIIGSRKEIYIRQRHAVITEIVEMNTVERYRVIPSGSKADGFVFPGSDFDCLYLFTNITVNTKQNNQYSDFVIETNDLKPGYAKLKLCLNNKSTCKYKLDKYASALVPVDNERVYLSSFKFLEEWIKEFNCLKITMKPHGPSGYHKNYQGTKVDSVACFSCRNWPNEANEWTQRQRKNNWPSQDLVNEIVENGVLLVPVGHSSSQERDLEWRISFNSAEKKLVYSMNYTQLLCYGLLKLYLKHVIDAREDCKGLLCSYFLKTALFYSIEENDVAWDPNNILGCFWTCFKRLRSWIKKGYCPNYFIKSNNMFEGKKIGDSLGILIEHIDNLYRDTDTLKRIPDLYSYVKLVKYPSLDSFLSRLLECNCDMQLGKSNYYFSITDKEMERVLSGIEMISRILSSKYVQPVDNLILTMRLASENSILTHYLYQQVCCSDLSDSSKNKKLYRLSGHILDKCSEHDICTGLLQYATLNYLTGKYDRVVSIIEKVITKFRDFVLYLNGGGECIDIGIKSYINEIYEQDSKIRNKWQYAFANSYDCRVSCNFYPEEMKVEVNEYKNLNVTFIPPNVYSYVLLFLAHHRTGKINSRNQTLDKLCVEVKNDKCFISDTQKPLADALLNRCVKIAELS